MSTTKLWSIGNINHPSIAKWGLNLFWYNFWFTDHRYFSPLHQDKILRTFFYIYVNFGMYFPTHPFINQYWYRSRDVNFDFDLNYNFKCFRIHNTPYDDSDTMGYYRTREKLDCVYLSRMWILRFDNWFILSFYCLRPKETNLVIKKKIKINVTNMNTITISRPTTLIFKRLKFIASYFYVATFQRQSQYLF